MNNKAELELALLYLSWYKSWLHYIAAQHRKREISGLEETIEEQEGRIEDLKTLIGRREEVIRELKKSYYSDFIKVFSTVFAGHHVMFLNPDGRVDYITGPFATFLGYDQKNMVGMGVARYIAKKNQRDIETLLTEGELKAKRVEFIRRGKRQALLTLEAAAIGYQKGEKLGVVLYVNKGGIREIMGWMADKGGDLSRLISEKIKEKLGLGYSPGEPAPENT